MIYIWILIMISLAFIMEIVDTSLGMMYGTLLSPIFIGYGFEPLVIIPAILISQAVGDISGTMSHQKFKNADFRGLTTDTKIVLAMVILNEPITPRQGLGILLSLGALLLIAI